MRLIRLDLAGYKRFREATVNLDGKIIAIVGPNEAGKSSLLDAVEHLESGQAISQGEISRDFKPPANHSYVVGLYLLDAMDFDGLDLAHARQLPRWMEVHWKGQSKAIGLKPYPHRDLAARESLKTLVRRIAKTSFGREFIAPSDPSTTPPVDHWSQAISVLESTGDKLAPEAIDVLSALASALPDDSHPILQRLAERLKSLIQTESEPSPEERARKHLASRTPDIAVFSDNERNLASQYQMGPELVAKAPAALDNLAQMAGLTLFDLWEAIQSGEAARVATLEATANEALAKAFAERWRQSNIAVRLRIDGNFLHILVSNPQGGYSSIAERSDGLRAFVALAAYAAQRPPGHGLILLIDEAENHLHYAAQADLVRMLARQTEAQQVFYTTHSIGCLPHDLGSGIRVVVPSDTGQESVIRNSFWAEGPGLTPLMLGMGASVLAFTPTRNAVIGEGGSDAILLPSMIREVTGLADLGYQIVPGLAEISPEAVVSLTAEAGRVVFLVDGDEAGRAIARKLRDAGIPDGRIIALGGSVDSGVTPEDLVSSEAYANAVNEELSRSRPGTAGVEFASVPESSRSHWLQTWADSAGANPPARVAVANRLVELGLKGMITAESHRLRLAALHNDIERALKAVQ